MFVNFRKKNCFKKDIRAQKKNARLEKKLLKEREKDRLALEKKVIAEQKAEAKLKRKEVLTRAVA